MIIKCYLNIHSNYPAKLGAQFELNFSEYGQIFHIKPSLITVTNQQKAGYFGIHGLLYNGSLKLWNPSPYNYSSLGFGFTIGTEYISSKLSIQAQTDLSIVNNAFRIKGDSNFLYYDDYNYDPGDDYYLLVGLSAGVNFFNAPEVRNKFFEPMPIPNYKKVKKRIFTMIQILEKSYLLVQPNLIRIPVNYYLLKPMFLTQILEKK